MRYITGFLFVLFSMGIVIGCKCCRCCCGYQSWPFISDRAGSVILTRDKESREARTNDRVDRDMIITTGKDSHADLHLLKSGAWIFEHSKVNVESVQGEPDGSAKTMVLNVNTGMVLVRVLEKNARCSIILKFSGMVIETSGGCMVVVEESGAVTIACFDGAATITNSNGKDSRKIALERNEEITIMPGRKSEKKKIPEKSSLYDRTRQVSRLDDNKIDESRSTDTAFDNPNSRGKKRHADSDGHSAIGDRDRKADIIEREDKKTESATDRITDTKDKIPLNLKDKPRVDVPQLN